MKFRAERAEFAEAAAWSLRTVGARVSLPALSGVRLEISGDTLVWSSHDLEVSSQLSTPVSGERDGVALVPGKLLSDVVRSLPQAAISAEVDGDRLRLLCGRARFDLRLMDVDDYPPLPGPAQDAPTAVLKADVFSALVGQVARAAGTDDARPVLTGVKLEAADGTLTAAATDSYRLAVRSVPWEAGTETTALVPRRALEEARRSADSLGGDVTLIIEDHQVTFGFGEERRLTTRLIDGNYPPYRQLLPTGFERTCTIDRAELFEVVRRIAVVGESNTSSTPISLDIGADTVEVSAGSGEVGSAEESLPGTLDGEPLKIAFNPRYLADGLDAAGGDQVVFELQDEMKPAILRPVGEDAGDFAYLLMPVRI